MKKVILVNLLTGVMIFGLLFLYNQNNIEKLFKDNPSVMQVKVNDQQINIKLNFSSTLSENLINILENTPPDYKIYFISESNKQIDTFWQKHKNKILELLINRKLTAAEELVQHLSQQRIQGQIVVTDKGTLLILKQNKNFLVELIPVNLLSSS
ncbi:MULTISPECIES: hypothetical protein [Carboxydocella]|uniref:Uncharacterized protein n=2 Tax=Carboxydocella TaxID=178898 RepID=A0A1T4LPC4_9FIRM|nr:MULTISPECIES: hypothetical protein [Carboxydocella]AVX20547.1 hypothetical protein CFE_1358 [Carboxydocella thermautotrophica]GAW31473.1 hypothetical protein JDF658_12380 [Carboxydocella sp. JDF658]SJZ56487.1 hypothetical protein SAMN02745885_00237 [Carboxydocella sporoproducens DSM 16521]